GPQLGSPTEQYVRLRLQRSRPVEITASTFGKVCSVVMPHLDERQRRTLAGALARAAGRGGIAMVASAAGMSRSTVLGAVWEIEGTAHPDRDAQFRYLNAQVEEHLAKAQPVISVDTPGL